MNNEEIEKLKFFNTTRSCANIFKSPILPR